MSDTAVGLRGIDGCVIALHKIMTDISGGTKCIVHSLGKSVGMVTCGPRSQTKHVVEFCGEYARTYRLLYGKEVSLARLSSEFSIYLSKGTQLSSLQPFTVDVILFAWSSENGAEFYHIDPSGVSFSMFGCSVGKNKETAKTELRKLDFSVASAKDLLKEAARIILKIHELEKSVGIKPAALCLFWVGIENCGVLSKCRGELYQDALNSGARMI